MFDMLFRAVAEEGRKAGGRGEEREREMRNDSVREISEVEAEGESSAVPGVPGTGTGIVFELLHRNRMLTASLSPRVFENR